MLFLVQRSCPYDGDFKCSDGRCLRSSRVCNGYSDCESGSDEQDCGMSNSIIMKLNTVCS